MKTYTFTEDQVKLIQDTLKFYADFNHIETLRGRIEWEKERDRLQCEGFLYQFESYDGHETFIEGGRKAQKALDDLENIVYDTDHPN